MDKKNLITGIACVCGAFGVMFWQSKQAPLVETAVVEQEIASTDKEQKKKSEPTSFFSVADDKKESLKPATVVAKEELFTLENNCLSVTFTTNGGAIKSVSMKKHPAVLGKKDPYVFNADAILPALALSFSDENGNPREYAPAYKMAGLDDNSI